MPLTIVNISYFTIFVAKTAFNTLSIAASVAIN